MTPDSNHQRLIEILQNAYSGELAAGYAYRGHWKSVTNPAEREAIQRIEQEEWAHRKRVGEMLGSLGCEPRKPREARLWMVGRTIGAACHVIGWFLPMYFAGRLESGNVLEYEEAAAHAATLGLAEFEADLRSMAAVEKEHELFFMNVIAGHRMLPVLQTAFKWPSSEAVETTAEAIAADPETASQTIR